ncbi:MAG TPA: hypothetical protein VGF70_09345 [Solirubrobacteraceae bacterium]|jgi:hypothetical protein
MTRSAVRVLKLAVAGLATAAVVGVTSADASHVVKIASHISIRSHNLTFSGRVTSPNHACVPMRRVTLYRTNGDVLGHTRTNSHGHWKITASGSAGISQGHFYAKVKRLSQGAAGTIYVCKGARSRTIPIHS